MPSFSREDILKMSDDEKIALINALMESFDPPEESSSEALTGAQWAELDRRIATLDEDIKTAVPAEDVIRRMRDRQSL